MFPTFIFGEFLAGLALISAALLSGYWLLGLSRRRPHSMLVNEGVVADMVCVGEVALLVGGVGLLIRAFASLF